MSFICSRQSTKCGSIYIESCTRMGWICVRELSSALEQFFSAVPHEPIASLRKMHIVCTRPHHIYIHTMSISNTGQRMQPATTLLLDSITGMFPLSAALDRALFLNTCSSQRLKAYFYRSCMCSIYKMKLCIYVGILQRLHDFYNGRNSFTCHVIMF